MSNRTQIEFIKLIKDSYNKHADKLDLSIPQILKDGFITSAIFMGKKGYVEMRCGPAEYGLEIFIEITNGKKERLGLEDLISIISVREWMERNPLITTKEFKLKTEIEYAFFLLLNGLKEIEKFDWVYKK